MYDRCMSQKVTVHNGLGLVPLSCLVLLTLKLADIGEMGDVSWWWVASPIWISLGLFLAVAAVVLVFGLAKP